ncbi:dethiobiotin synthase [Balneolaceae bacterium YR4-1]|uniref:ATP-dependent dethiobiotin synthetase BioD n=1 Tax=Halalkalibaculum roseum TaxID=2709311 RepID=A0A6M1T7L1_9BACT|nr:dethiobiotin synthase [Halalkalibaculum roseum]NGP76243.1 dethiobiotin synthase [Halalkalibaculum roseum]
MRLEEFPSNIFISGTDTGIGKTVVSAMVTLGLSATYWKPVQSGLEEETDTEFVKRVTGLPDTHFKPERYRLQEPLSPHASAAIDGVSISLDDFQLPDTGSNNLVVEGAGGLLVPLNDDDMIIDLIEKFRLPVLLVVRSELGTLNHTFLSLEALRNRNIPIIGVVMNGPKNESNRKAIEKYGRVEVLGEIEPLQTLDPKTLKNEFNKIFKS